MSKRQAHTSGSTSLDASHPFLPLEETMRSNSGADIESSLDEIPMDFEASSRSNSRSNSRSSMHDARTSITSKTPKRRNGGGKKNDDDEYNNDDYDDDYPNDDDDDDEYNLDDEYKNKNNKNKNNTTATATFAAVSPGASLCQNRKLPDPKQGAWAIIGCFFALILWECFFVEPEDRLIKPDFSDRFLTWVQSNPTLGLGAILVVIAAAVVSLVPIGTPLTLGCGYIYRGVYGWKLGLVVSTAVSMAGSTLGAVTCFLLGRYLMRDTVKRWVRNYPMFDAIDVAVSEQGLKIMAMLYLTPVLPLGLVSYMCGTTAMDLQSFVVAKIASLPLYLMYTFMGASAHSFIKGGKTNTDLGKSLTEEANKLEENQYLILSGLVLSAVMIGLITRKIKKELMKILDEQKKEKVDDGRTSLLDNDEADEKTIEMGLTARRKNNSKLSQKQ